MALNKLNRPSVSQNLYLPSRLGLKNTPIASQRRGKPPPHNKSNGYDPKKSDSEVPVLQELWGMRSTLSLPLLPGPLLLGMVAPDRVQSVG